MKDLRPSERHAERQALERLDRPINYKCNPRLNAIPTGTETDTKPRNMFVAEPESLAFTQYELGNSYQIVLQLRNVDSVSRQLRVIPPTRKEFKIDTGTKVRLDRVDKTGRQIHLQTDRQTDREIQKYSHVLHICRYVSQ
jgi:hypothetical protein